MLLKPFINVAMMVIAWCMIRTIDRRKFLSQICTILTYFILTPMLLFKNIITRLFCIPRLSFRKDSQYASALIIVSLSIRCHSYLRKMLICKIECTSLNYFAIRDDQCCNCIDSTFVYVSRISSPVRIVYSFP